MKWFTVGLIFGAISSLGDHAVAAAHDPSGVYSSLQYNDQAGDLLGMAIEIHAVEPSYVIVLVSDGNCQDRKRWPLVIVGNRLSFSVAYEAVDQSGHSVTLEPIRYVGVLNGSIIVLTAPDAPEIRERLKRIRNPQAILAACASS